MEVIVLQSTKYKEKDSIITALSKSGPVSFRARGALESKSSLMWLNNILTVADVDLVESKYKYPILNGATMVSPSIIGGDDLDYLFAVSALAGITREALAESEQGLIYDDLLAAVKALRRSKDALMIILLYLARCIRYAGVEPEVDRCVYSGKREDIVAFSFEDGGFVSREYVNENTNLDLTPMQLKLIRYLFKAPDFSCIQTSQFSKEDKIKILDKFVEFIDENAGAKVTSVDYLRNN